MSGGEISCNTNIGARSAAVDVRGENNRGPAVFVMTGGVISNNCQLATSNVKGGAGLVVNPNNLSTNRCRAALLGGKICNNISAGGPGGILYAGNQSLSIGGSLIVSDNHSGTQLSNLTIPANTPLWIEEPLTGDVGVTPATTTAGSVLANNASASDELKFSMDTISSGLYPNYDPTASTIKLGTDVPLPIAICDLTDNENGTYSVTVKSFAQVAAEVQIYSAPADRGDGTWDYVSSSQDIAAGETKTITINKIANATNV